MHSARLDQQSIDQRRDLGRGRDGIRRLARPPACEPDALHAEPLMALAEPCQALVFGQHDDELERRRPRRIQDALRRREPRGHARADEERLARADDLEIVELGQRVGDPVADLGRLEAIVWEVPARVSSRN